MNAILIISFSVLLILILLIYFKYFFHLRPKEDGFEFVYVEDNGSVRELDAKEKEYLSEKFKASDSGRPYIKSYYRQLTPNGKISGYINRRRVPKKITIKT